MALSVAAVVCIASSNGGTTSQDLKTGFLVGATPRWQQLSIVVGSLSSALVIGVILMALNQAGTVYSQKNLVQPKRPLDMAALRATALRESPPGDRHSYYVWHATEGNAQGVPPGRYLVDDRGQIRWLVDPGISGRLTHRDDGTPVAKFHPPQAEMFALITHGILNQKLPWILVILGVMLALVMELCGVSSLPFAVGVYLPLSSTTPIFVGGLVRYVVERVGRRRDKRRGVGTGIRNESRRVALDRLHRRRHDCRCAHRVFGVSHRRTAQDRFGRARPIRDASHGSGPADIRPVGDPNGAGGQRLAAEEPLRGTSELGRDVETGRRNWDAASFWGVTVVASTSADLRNALCATVPSVWPARCATHRFHTGDSLQCTFGCVPLPSPSAARLPILPDSMAVPLDLPLICERYPSLRSGSG